MRTAGVEVASEGAVSDVAPFRFARQAKAHFSYQAEEGACAVVIPATDQQQRCVFLDLEMLLGNIQDGHTAAHMEIDVPVEESAGMEAVFERANGRAVVEDRNVHVEKEHVRDLVTD